MKASQILRLSVLAAVLAASGSFATAANAQSAPAPKWNVGDKWVYNVKSGVGISPINYQETREVVAVAGGVIKLRITGKTANGQDFTRDDEYAGPGAMKFGAPCADEAYRFPTAGELYQIVTSPVANLPNPNLRPERALSEEVMKMPRWAVNQGPELALPELLWQFRRPVTPPRRVHERHR